MDKFNQKFNSHLIKLNSNEKSRLKNALKRFEVLENGVD